MFEKWEFFFLEMGKKKLFMSCSAFLISLSLLEDESMEPPDPLIALKYSDTETVTSNIAFSLVP